jgi:hypothetical protein
MKTLILPLEAVRKTSDSNSWQSYCNYCTFMKHVLRTSQERQKLCGLFPAFCRVLLKSTKVLFVDQALLSVHVEPYLTPVSALNYVLSLQEVGLEQRTLQHVAP